MLAKKLNQIVILNCDNNLEHPIIGNPIGETPLAKILPKGLIDQEK